MTDSNDLFVSPELVTQLAAIERLGMTIDILEKANESLNSELDIMSMRIRELERDNADLQKSSKNMISLIENKEALISMQMKIAKDLRAELDALRAERAHLLDDVEAR